MVEVEVLELLVREVRVLLEDKMDILYFGRNLDTDQVLVGHSQENQNQDEGVSDDLGQVVYIDRNHLLVHHTLDSAVEEEVDNCCQEDHIAHVDTPEELLQGQEVEEDTLEMEEDSNLMLEVDHREDIQDLVRIRSLGWEEEEVHSHAEVDHNNLVVVAEKNKTIQMRK